jgi:kelch-like protein 9/13/kelch-like protein 26
MAACAFGSNIYVFGGYDSGTSVFKFDTTANQWSTLTAMPMRSFGSFESSASVLDGLVYLVGAGNGEEVMSFNPTSDTWMTLAPTLHSRKAGASFVLQGCLYATGGLGSARSSAERYDVARNKWTPVTPMHEDRLYPGAVTFGSTGPTEDEDLFDLLIAKAAIVGP